MRLRRCKPVRIQLTNGFGIPTSVVELVPGQTATVTVHMTQNVCDRGFPNEDGVHRLTSRTFDIPVRMSLAEDQS